MRLASQVDIGFPYKEKDVCWIVLEGGNPRQLGTTEAKRGAIRRALAGEVTLYAVWPGMWTSDFFLLDDLAAAAAALGVMADA